AIRINSRFGAANGTVGLVRWVAPPETGFVYVRSEAKLRRGSGHFSRIFMADAEGRETERIATGDNSAGAFRAEEWRGTRQEQFVAALGCDERSGCPVDEAAKTWVRSVRMELADYADPEVSTSGSLVEPGWKRGEHALSFSSTDVGSGLASLDVTVNGSSLSAIAGDCSGEIAGTNLASRLVPCSEAARGNVAPSTASLPFHDGSNLLETCGTDFAGNRTCKTRQVQVDNTAPALRFTDAQDPEDPELIRAPVSDTYSGVANGAIYYRAAGATIWQPLETVLVGNELQARVDSTAVPPGTYEFRAVASDVAGNPTETTLREDGLEKQLEFPLKAGVILDAALAEGGSRRATIDYGRRSETKGILRDASGEPLQGQEIVVTEFFGEGALIRERVSRVLTDERGRWRSMLPPGPSRTVSATYEGTQRYLPETTSGGRLAVRTKATFRPSRRALPEGERVVFRGRLGRLGARVPNGGKLLELQVKQDRKQFQTVGEGFRSRSNGRFAMAYRFGRFYSDDVRFKFRVKVAREADWPYKAPVRSNARTVTVKDRDG
ncbi:MAG: carboxypeptidase-like regulatory domain-containing protein, partial [Actinomycetota bacterium]|nr:carboxypeptidase-like regulatory domain-containing protein [Actinomycetota bacterium]